MKITYDNQIEISKKLFEKTNRKVYFDCMDLVDEETSRTIFPNVLNGNYSLQDLINAIVLLKPYIKR